jgi:hypothetical protein
MLLDNYETMRQDNLETLSSSFAGSDLPRVPSSSRTLELPKPCTWTRPPCKDPSCGSSEIFEDVNGGSVVCLACGLIQSMFVLESASTNAIFHGGVSRIVVHRYSRIAYLRGVFRSIKGETRIELDPSEQERLQSYIQNDASPSKVPMGLRVKRAIKALRLPPKLLYHAHTIAFMLFKTPTPNPSEQEIRDVLRLFHVLENAWDRLPLDGSIRKGRKKFLSFPVVWKQLCLQLGFVGLSTLLPPLRSKKLRDKQLLIFDQLVVYINQ